MNTNMLLVPSDLHHISRKVLYSESDIYHEPIEDRRPPLSPPLKGFFLDIPPTPPTMQLALPSSFFNGLKEELSMCDTTAASNDVIIAAVRAPPVVPTLSPMHGFKVELPISHDSSRKTIRHVNHIHWDTLWSP